MYSIYLYFKTMLHIGYAVLQTVHRGVTRALIGGGGGGGVYVHIFVFCPFLLKSVIFKCILKEISRAEREYMNIPPLPNKHSSYATDCTML